MQINEINENSPAATSRAESRERKVELVEDEDDDEDAADDEEDEDVPDDDDDDDVSEVVDDDDAREAAFTSPGNTCPWRQKDGG